MSNKQLNDFMPGGNMTDNKKNFIGMDIKQIKQEIIVIDEKPFRSKQIYSWIYSKGAKSIDDMTDLSIEAHDTRT